MNSRFWMAAIGTALLLGGACASKPEARQSAEEPRATLAEAQALNERALQAQKAGRADEAIELYRRVVQAEPRMHQAWNNLGVLYMDRHDYMEAALALKSAADLQPTDPVPLENLGLAYYRAGHARRSLEYYLQALERDANRVEAYRGAYRASELLGLRDQEALERVEQALMVEPDAVWRDLYMQKKIWLSTEVGGLGG